MTSDVDLGDLRNRIRALARRLEPGQFFSHATAAYIHGFPLPRRLCDPARELDITVFQPARAPQLSGVRSHELKPTGQLTLRIDDLPVIGPEDAWAQLADDLTATELVVCADWLITGDEPYSGALPPSTVETLDRAIARRGRMRGVRTLRMARDRCRYGSLSPQETRLRLLVVDSGLPEPKLNHRVRDKEGRVVAMVDLAYPEKRIAIEYLGDHHRATASAYRDDILRRERLIDRGWSVLFTTSSDLHSPEFLLIRLRRMLASTGNRS